MVVQGEGHIPQKGPRIRDLIERRAKWRDGLADLSKIGDQTGRDHAMRAEGLREAYDIMTNPYNYLDDQERVGWEAAEGNADKIVSDRAGEGPSPQRILPAGQAGPTLAQVKAAQATATPVVTRRKKTP